MEVLQILLSLLVIVLMESILSIDNAAVIAVIVNKNLSDQKERNRALRWGMLGAYILRAACLGLVSLLLNNPAIGDWFRIIGGLYLLYLAYGGLTPAKDTIEEGEVGWADKLLKRLNIGIFWSTVIVVEMVDLVFSVDNLVAVISLSDKFWVIVVGVFIGIAVMRFVATQFSKLLERFPGLNTAAFIVIAFLGVKLIISGIAGEVYHGDNVVNHLMEQHWFDLAFSGLMMLIFFFPLMKPKNKEIVVETELFDVRDLPKKHSEDHYTTVKPEEFEDYKRFLKERKETKE